MLWRQFNTSTDGPHGIINLQMLLTDIAKIRLYKQQITNTKFTDAVDTVEWLGAVQAQEYAQTKWSLGLRLKNINDDDIERSFSEGKVLRTHLLRPTWHFVSAKDIYWLLELTAPRVQSANAFMYRKLELDSKVFNVCNNILENILQGRKQLTRNSINESFRKNNIVAQGHRLSYIMMNAELEGIICSGARQGNQFTYALLEERAKPTKQISRDEALAKLTTRYFKSRSPATVKDFSTWSGLSLIDCKKGIETIEDALKKETIEETEYYYLKDTKPINKVPDDIYLLPIYDEFIMGYKDRNAIMQFKNSLKFNPPFHYDSMIVQNGQVIGTWKRTINKSSIDMKVQFFSSFDGKQKRAFDTAVQCFEEFHGSPVSFNKTRSTNR